jgi:hypothetical protein
MPFARTPRSVLLGLAALGLVAGPAAAEVKPWDQAHVSSLAKQLQEATQALYDAFYKQPPPQRGSGQAREYQRLKHEIRRVRIEARQLATQLAEGEGREETLPGYEDLMQTVRSAEDHARRVFSTSDVQAKAAVARMLVDQIRPYYEEVPPPG